MGGKKFIWGEGERNMNRDLDKKFTFVELFQYQDGPIGAHALAVKKCDLGAHNSGYNHVKLKEKLAKREEKKFKSRSLEQTFIYLGKFLKNCYVLLKTFSISFHNHNFHRKNIGSRFTMIGVHFLSFHLSNTR